jgi:N-acetylmuramic acid 6-phosphate etherase
MVDLDRLTTEASNVKSDNLDILPVGSLLRLMNDEDHRVAGAVSSALGQIEAAVVLVADAFRRGGRLVYIGAGTSGRLGMLDAVECPPTFDSDPGQVVALIAGGASAFARAVEGAEDSPELARRDLQAIALGSGDVVVGIAASGRTPYVIGGLDYATSVDAATISVACNPDAPISAHADVAIEIDSGPEILTGSTRLKAGTGQKMVLNMITTAAMVQTGKVYRNLMVDLRPTNAKLVTRAKRIVMTATGCNEHTAEAAYAAADGNAKTAIVMIIADCTRDQAVERLRRSGGFVRGAVTADEMTQRR